MAIMVLSTHASFAQVSGRAFDGFGGNSKAPINIESDQLNVEDSKARATFQGNVLVRQGASVIKTKKLVVHYKRGSEGSQGDIERLVLSGGLVVTSGKNRASANDGTYNVQTEDIVLVGDVVVSQGKSVATGCKLVANLKTDVAKLSACKKTNGKSGRVKSVFTPGSSN